MKTDYKQIIESLKDKKKGEHVVLCDSLNTFIRNFTISQHVNTKGNHIGGMVGFLRSIGYVVKTFKPTKVYLAFEGEGSTINKKYLYPEYKANRNIKPLTKWEYFETLEDEKQSMQDQLLRLIDYLKNLPVYLIAIDRLEGDEIIGYLTHYYEQQETCSKITIISADQDFLQLASPKTEIHSPVKKKTYTPEVIFEEYGLHPNNFLTQKILMGDSSDNVPGVEKLGPKKLFKLFPEITGKDDFTLQDIYKKCEDNLGVNFLYESILNFRPQLEINHKLMSLKNHTLYDTIAEEISNFPLNSLNIKGFMELYQEDLLDGLFKDPQTWLRECFGYLSI